MYNLCANDFRPCQRCIGHQQQLPFAASGAAIAFHPTVKTIYLVGTEEGKIFKCSTLYGSKYIFTYVAHTMPIHKLSYNRFCPSIFLSCSADWTVKIWADMRR